MYQQRGSTERVGPRLWAEIHTVVAGDGAVMGHANRVGAEWGRPDIVDRLHRRIVLSRSVSGIAGRNRATIVGEVTCSLIKDPGHTMLLA